MFSRNENIFSIFLIMLDKQGYRRYRFTRKLFGTFMFTLLQYSRYYNVITIKYIRKIESRVHCLTLYIKAQCGINS